MKAALKFNILLSFFVLILFGLKASAFIFMACVLYCIVSIRAYMQERWSVAAVLFFIILCMLYWLPMVASNFYIFYSGSNVFYDSPGTILVVGIFAILFAFPSSFLFLYFICKYKNLITLFVGEERAKGFKDGKLAFLLVSVLFISIIYLLAYIFYKQYMYAVEIDVEWPVSRRHLELEEEALDVGEFQ